MNKIIFLMILILFSESAFAKIEYFNFSEEEKEKVERSMSVLNRVLESEEFKAAVLKFEFIDTNGLSNQEIYSLITSEPIDLQLELYYANNRTVGYTYPGNQRIFINEKFFRGFRENEVAGNLIHEWSHKLGFKHSFQRTPGRDSSVPYALGSMVEKLSAHTPFVM